MIEVVGRGFIGSRIPEAPWSDRNTALYLRWHGTDKAGRKNRETQFRNVEVMHDVLHVLTTSRFAGVGSWAEMAKDTPYGRCKDVARSIAEDYCRQRGISFAWAQLFTVYGPGDKEENLIPTVARKLLGGEEVQLDSCRKHWNFLYVDDAAQALLVFARSETEGVRQLIHPISVSVRQVVEALRDIIGAPADQVVFEGDDVKPGAEPYLTDVVPYFPARSLRDGLERTVEWIREH